MSPSTIYQVETGKARPRGRTLRRIAEALGVDVEALTVGEERES